MMLSPRQMLGLVVIGAILLCPACLRKSITEKQIAQAVQAYMDAPADPSDDNALTAEERAAIESFDVYRNKLKLQLAEGTDPEMREPVGKKMVRAFALACRGVGKFEVSYVVELYTRETIDNKKSNFLVGEIRFDNASERIYPEMYKPIRR